MKHALIASLYLVTLAHPALAQETAPPAEPPAAPPQAESTDTATEEDIVVTGSRIRGTGPVGSNLISVGAQDMEQQPTATVTEFLRKVPQIQGFGIDASSATSQGSGGTNTTRGSSINLRGLGPQATLTLLDNQRMSPSGVAGNYTDPTAIPTIAIERVEIVADGASAVYGSDAVSGVVNFVTRKSYDGVLARARYGFADNYWLAQGSVLVGKNWGSGNLTIAYEHTERDNLNGGERSYVRSDLRDYGGSDYRNSQCNPGNIIVGGVPYAIPAGGVTPGNASSLLPNTRNLCENLRFGDILPAENRDSVLVNLRQELTGKLTFRAQLLYSDRDYVAKAVQQGSTSNIVNLTVPRANAFYVTPPGTNPNSVTVEYDFSSELGLINQNGKTEDWRATAGLDWDIGKDWQISIAGLYGEDRSSQYSLRVNTPALTRALASSDPATAFNPFGGVNSQAVLDAIFTGLFNPYATNQIKGGSAQASGTLFGGVRLAVGGEILEYANVGGSLQGDIAAPDQRDFTQRRTQRSAFAELFVPIFGTDNARPGFERLDLSLAGRIDDYNDVGTTRNPKVGINWSPVRGVLLKGSFGKSFRAPSIQDLPLLRTGSNLSVVTWLDPQSSTGTSVGINLNAGNPDLKPEKATTYSFSAELQPTSIPGLRASMTYFKIDYQDVIAFPPRTTQSLLDPTYAFAVTRNPSNALIQSYLDQGLPLSGVRPPVIAFFYNAQPVNLGSLQTDGFDFVVDYRAETGFGNLTFNANGSYLLNYKVAISDTSDPVQQLGNINYPVKFRAQGSVGWEKDGFSTELLVNYVDSYRNNLVTPVQKVSAYTTFDLHLGYDFSELGGVLDGTQLSFDVSNVFDKRAPFVNIVGGFDPGQASALGRFVAITLSKKLF